MTLELKLRPEAAADWQQIAPLGQALLNAQPRRIEELEFWLVARSDFDAACSEARANLYIRMTCFTSDPDAAGAWARYLDEVEPKLKKLSFELDRKQTQLFQSIGELVPPRYSVLDRKIRADVELFREENIPLETEVAKLDQEYDRIRGEQTVTFRGKTWTVAQMARFLQDLDRETRREAWMQTNARMIADRESIDAIFDRMIALRHQIAGHAGFSSYRDFAFRARHRFDYGVRECEAFHNAVEEHCVPFVRRLDDRRRRHLGLEHLRPWDLSVDEKGRAPLRPFENAQELVAKSQSVFRNLDLELAALFELLGDDASPGGSLDLESRKGKAPGGYQYMRDWTRMPFIFMNAAGLHRDVETMVHEAGHAFHSLLCRNEPLLAYRDSPIEFAEVASMSMELMTMDHWNHYYPTQADADRARRKQLEGAISLLPWIATIDAFQHWIYTNPRHTRDDRTREWIALDQHFGHALDWTGLEVARATSWQKQPHLFGTPFYYIEYGIAQLGALGLWLRSKKEGVDVALQAYKSALSLGGSRPLPELFAAAGIPFDFGASRVREIVGAVEAELSRMPE